VTIHFTAFFDIPMIQFPELFENRTRSLLGDDYPLLKEALQETTPVSIRVNTKKSDYHPSDSRVAWSKQGFYLDQRPLFTADPLLHAGVYYVQEASSMVLDEVVRQLAPDARCVLDLCAAPGGKSTLLSEALHPEALLISNEFVRSRAMILAENLLKWGNPNIIVTNNAPADFQKTPSLFDLMVVDAPCSGEGMFRKDPTAITEWSLSNVQQCAIRQKKILEDAWDALKQDGVLIYSTCTYNREENEETVQWICNELGAEFLPLDCSAFNGIEFSGFGYRFYPHRIKGEGFFIAAMRKTAASPAPARIKTDLRKLKLQLSQRMTTALIPANNFMVLEDDLQLFALPGHLYDTVLFVRSQLHCIVAGVQLADKKGKDLIPAHQLAMSKNLNRSLFAVAEVDLPTALNYLKREAIYIENAPVGFVLITYLDQVLGWVKNMGNRSNNLYPQHWRIRMNL
jgi:16S rRNA C967 or C1407 C5-methylase (RsmB/RsmF family)/NOL1/NOP2/fmu family ribosome biogenesis protein